ncbi:hypothetical protein GH714_006791 [Hevea brasiliensis]|uniref:Myb/SANT-like DNA-binding domain-containing protein n=1 Tax=Hevea brasiliensis TaxID=3981 RepID=A0A6A6MY57_HEVBR|nr:hypothetical protein GH714_006791 [Hevea brasiliensis]
MADHQYDLPDLRQLVAGRTHFQGNPFPFATEPFFLQTRTHGPQIHHFHHHDSIVAAAAASAHSGAEVMLPSGFIKLAHDHYCTNATTTTTTAADAAATSSGAAGSFFGVEMESGWIGNDAGNIVDGQGKRLLLFLRSDLGWIPGSRRLIKRVRYGMKFLGNPNWFLFITKLNPAFPFYFSQAYKRSGKKCREKFENLYKYYKKTKEGKAGRQDGKHYRFFRQLEALYGEPSNQTSAASETHLVNTTSFLYQTPTTHTINQENQESFQENKHSESLSFSNISEFETSSSENDDVDLSAVAYMMNGSIEKMKGLSEEVGGETRSLDGENVKTIEDREQERMRREEEWTKQEVAHLDRIHEFWARKRAWIEARDAALMDSLKKYTAKGLELPSSSTSVDEQIAIATQSHYRNQDRNAKTMDIHGMNTMRWMEPEILSLIQLRTTMEPRFQESGYSKEGLRECNMTTTECNKKRKEDLRTSNYFQSVDPYNDQEMAKHDESLNSPSNSYVGSQVHGSRCFHQDPISGGEHMWNKYGLKLSKEKNQQL